MIKKKIIITTIITLIITVFAFGQESTRGTKKKVVGNKEIAQADNSEDKAKIETVMTYQEFKKGAEKKLREIDKSIAAISTKVESMDEKDRTAYVMKVKNLKDKSRNLKARLYGYKNDDKGELNKRGSFRKEFQKDVQNLDDALDNFFGDKKK